jgi:predicted amidohydrolase
MNLVILQPPYPADESEAEKTLEWMIAQLEKITPGSADLVLLPEYANVPGINDRVAMQDFASGRGMILVDTLIEMAERLKCLMMAGLVERKPEERWVNLAAVYDASGGRSFIYEKVHLTQFERDTLQLSAGNWISTCEMQGVVYGFAICFDAYFPEHFAALAKQKVDVILCPSYQRSESPERLEVMTCTRAIDSGAYVVRSSYAMPEGNTGGCSMVAAPEGSIIGKLEGDAGVLRVKIDPALKWNKPRSHRQLEIEHRELIDLERRPGLY